MENSIIDRISSSCSCDQDEAREYLDNEIGNLRELKDLDDLRFDDLETACSNLGLDNDDIEYFINVLAS
jgi:hypothetical protein